MKFAIPPLRMPSSIMSLFRPFIYSWHRVLARRWAETGAVARRERPTGWENGQKNGGLPKQPRDAFPFSSRFWLLADSMPSDTMASVVYLQVLNSGRVASSLLAGFSDRISVYLLRGA